MHITSSTMFHIVKVGIQVSWYYIKTEESSGRSSYNFKACIAIHVHVGDPDFGLARALQFYPGRRTVFLVLMLAGKRHISLVPRHHPRPQTPPSSPDTTLVSRHHPRPQTPPSHKDKQSGQPSLRLAHNSGT